MNPPLPATAAATSLSLQAAACFRSAFVALWRAHAAARAAVRVGQQRKAAAVAPTRAQHAPEGPPSLLKRARKSQSLDT